ncbi:hypothetical protein BDF22DRAFT_741057 [Syncephalis plumigaleata]|nr:hypothetical protein BDF22DRAFT_741057 [Syncephalis plumigaleata]
MVALSVLLLLATGPLSQLGAHAEECVTPRVRKEINDLTPDELKEFFDAMRIVQTRPAPDRPSFYDDISYFHNYHSGYSHGTPRELQRHKPGVTMPYWDWSAVSQAPETSIVFTDAMYGGNGRGASQCVKDGNFKDFKPFFRRSGDPDCLWRNFEGGGKMKPYPITDVIASIVANSKTWDAFQREIEGTPHGRVHNAVGGAMTTMFSPNDPIFYCTTPISIRSVYAYYGRDKVMNRDASLDHSLPQPFPHVRVRDAMSVRGGGMCYTYQDPIKIYKNVGEAATATLAKRSLVDLQRRDVNPNMAHSSSILTIPVDMKGSEYNGPPSGLDRSFLTVVRPTEEIPEPWLIMMNVNVTAVRHQEKRINVMCNELNKVEGYMSPSALWYHQTSLEQIVVTEKVFRVYINGRLVEVSNTDLDKKAGHKLSITERISSIKSSFKQAGLKIIKDIRERARALRRILGCGFDRVANKFKAFGKKVTKKVKDMYEGTKKALLKHFTSSSTELLFTTKAAQALDTSKDNDSNSNSNNSNGSNGSVLSDSTTKSSVTTNGATDTPIVATPATKGCNKKNVSMKQTKILDMPMTPATSANTPLYIN